MYAHVSKCKKDKIKGERKKIKPKKKRKAQKNAHHENNNRKMDKMASTTIRQTDFYHHDKRSSHWEHMMITNMYTVQTQPKTHEEKPDRGEMRSLSQGAAHSRAII
jgi:hypothetical protein